MPSTYTQFDLVTLTTKFISYNIIDDSEVLAFPDTVSGAVYKLNISTLEYEPYSVFTPDLFALGEYRYIWSAPENGKFKIEFTASFASGQTSVNTRFVIVGPLSNIKTLGSNVVYHFLTELDPIYLNPELVLNYYSDADLTEVTELIHWYSLEIKSLLNVREIKEVTQLMQDFILASVLCDLSKIYTYNGGLSGFSSSDSFTLGDLQVKTSSGVGGPAGGMGFNRGTVTSWCELAALLRQELTSSNNNLKAIVKGSNFHNPIPVRALRRFD